MRFAPRTKPKYRDAIELAIEKIIEIGNPGHVETARNIRESDVRIGFVPLKKIGCSGVTGLISSRATNRRIDSEELSIREALSEVYIDFADWTFDVAGQRGCQGTLVHEGLHACDFARIISGFSYADMEPLGVVDMSLYELEHRAAVASAEYLVLTGQADFIDEGRQLGLVGLDVAGAAFVDVDGIISRMQNGYGLNEREQGVMMSSMLGIRPKGEGFSFRRLLGLEA